MSGAGSRRKGHQFERDIAIALRAIFPKAQRHLEYQHGEANGVDIANTGRFKIQCKKLKRYAPISMINEVQREPGDDGVPVLITAGDNLPPMVVISLAEFLWLIREERTPDAYR